MDMKRQTYLFAFLFAIAPATLTCAFGAETELGDTQSIMMYDGQPILHNANNITKYQHPQHGDSDAQQLITFGGPVDGNLVIKIPKSLAVFTEVVSESGLHFSDDRQRTFSVFAINGNDELQVKYGETDCFASYSIELSGTSGVEIISASVLATEFEWHVTEPPPYCGIMYESLRQLDTAGCNVTHIPQLNNRGELVCIFETSAQKLISWGYLI